MLAFTRCLDIDGTRLDARIQRGNASYELRRYEDAIVDFDAVLAATPDAAGVVCNRGNALLELKRYDEAARAFERVLALDAAYPYALGKRVYAQTMACDWRDLDALVAQVQRRPGRGPRRDRAVRVRRDRHRSDGAAPLRRAVRRRPVPGAARTGGAAAQRLGNAKIRIGYLGGEFRNQATSILAVELFELHDKQPLRDRRVRQRLGRRQHAAPAHGRPRSTRS